LQIYARFSSVEREEHGGFPGWEMTISELEEEEIFEDTIALFFSAKKIPISALFCNFVNQVCMQLANIPQLYARIKTQYIA